MVTKQKRDGRMAKRKKTSKAKKTYFDEQRELNQNNREAIMKTIEICKQEGVLTAFLAEHEKEVIDIMYPIFTEKQQRELDLHDAREEGRKEGERKGREDGREEERFSMVQNLMKTLGKGASEAMDMLLIPAADRVALNRRLSAQP